MPLLLRYLLGRPLSTEEEGEQRVGVLDGVAVFGLDALGSTAYGPEAALTVLIPVGALALRYVFGLSMVITALLLIVFFSYRQTIGAYPNGGGAYTVAGQNLGPHMGMLAGAALMLDYLLNVCVGISTGVGALVSAAPSLEPHTLPICLGVLGVILLANLRGVREAGLLWMLPTYLFVGCLTGVTVMGIMRVIAAGGHPHALANIPVPSAGAAGAVGSWWLIRSFAAGCTALTGVEAVSNGVRTFKDPREERAKGTLTLIVGILAFLLLGLSYLVQKYGIVATEPGKPGYQSVLSLLTSAVTGRGVFYYVTIGSILAVLSLSANTSFAGFPQLCRVLADDGYLPRAFTIRGRRLAYTCGVVVLGVCAAGVLIVFGGVTDRLIPLFAIGAFLAFTLSQAGMVAHWRKSDEKHRWASMAINGTGALATGITTLIVFVAKFSSGAWLSLVLLMAFLLALSAVRKHYDRVERYTHISEIRLDSLPRPPMMLVPVARWNKATVAGLQLACSLSDDVRVLHIAEVAEEGDATCGQWQSELDEAARASGSRAPRVVSICSPYRSVTGPIMEYVKDAEEEEPRRKIAVVIAEIVAAHWYHQIMHNYRAMLLRLRLFWEGNRRVVIVNLPWQLPPE